MKRCPECRRDYYDDTLLFCLDDGNALLEGPATAKSEPPASAGGQFDDEPQTAILQSMATPGEAPKRAQIGTSSEIADISNGNSIAVLPFVNTSADADNEYFCDGLAEELLNALAKIDQLKVAARTSAFSFKGKNTDISSIGRTLGVKTILEGSVRKSGDRLRISVQLVNAADGYQLWSERYDREVQDIFDIEDEITLAVVSALKLRLFDKQKAAILKRYTDNAEAYQLYLKGRYYLNKWTAEGLKKGVEYFNQVIEMDPEFALAYSGLADCYGSLSGEMLRLSPKDAFPRAKAAALKALEMDESLAEAHTSLALIKLNFDWDWTGAEARLKRAIELNPNYVAAYHWYSHCLVIMGRLDESLEVSNTALKLDPLDLEINAHLGWHYCQARLHDLAVDQCQRTIEMDSNFHEAHWFLGWAFEQKEKYDKAIDEFQKAVACSNGSDRMTAELGHAYGLAGKMADAQDVLDKLRESSTQHYVSPYNIALVLAGLGRTDEAFAELHKACDDRSGLLIYLKTQHSFDNLHSDPRFAAITERLNLPQ